MIDVEYVEAKEVSCDGQGAHDTLGHPRIYLNLGNKGKIECPYCSRVFILQENDKKGHSKVAK